MNYTKTFAVMFLHMHADEMAYTFLPELSSIVPTVNINRCAFSFIFNRSYKHCRKMSEDKIQGNTRVETAERRTIPEKDGRLKSLLKKSYLTRWVGVSDGSDLSSHPHHERPHQVDFARSGSNTLYICQPHCILRQSLVANSINLHL